MPLPRTAICTLRHAALSPRQTAAPWPRHANNIHPVMEWCRPTQVIIEIRHRGPRAASSSPESIVYLLLAVHGRRLPWRGMDLATNPDEFDDLGRLLSLEVRTHIR